MKSEEISKLVKVRTALADYIRSEGCECCEDVKPHRKAKKRLAKLLDVPKYEDENGYKDYDFSLFETKDGEND